MKKTFEVHGLGDFLCVRQCTKAVELKADASCPVSDRTYRVVVGLRHGQDTEAGLSAARHDEAVTLRLR